MTLKIIARMHSQFGEKFGIPRQSGVVEALESTIVFEPEYRNADALRGLEDFSHLWLVWGFSEVRAQGWSPTVRPPRLGGNTRMGVFATRSPYRPNPIGLSAVRLEGIEHSTPLGPVIHVLGADLMDGSPIYDIKPYLPYTDCREDAAGGFAAHMPDKVLEVIVPQGLSARLPAPLFKQLQEILALDPRPQYQQDPQRSYALQFGGHDVRFQVADGRCTVTDIVAL